MNLPRLFSLTLLLAPFSHLTAAQAKPNILLILADDMGFSDAGCYGGEISTPNLDALAKNGLRFTQFYNTARCWPSRAAILTGYYAQQVRRDGFPDVPGSVAGSAGIRPQWAHLLPDHLKALGYHSYHSGKWHIDGKPLENGFEHSYSLDDHDRHFTPKKHTLDDQPLPPVASGENYYSSKAIADYAVQQLKGHAEKHPDEPFFEFVAFTAPHFPVQAPADDIARYSGRYTTGWDHIREERWKRQKEGGLVHTTLSALEPEVGPPYAFPEAVKGRGPGEVDRPFPWNELDSGQKDFQAKKMEIHAAMIDRMDREIGRIVDQLQAMGAFENTLILFLSDNGASAEMMVRGDGHDPSATPGSGATFLSIGPGWSSAANTPLRRHKTWVHEGGISTPLIAHWPQGIRSRGELENSPLHIVDLTPTILDAAGGTPLNTSTGTSVPASPGKSLLPIFGKTGDVSHDSLWWLHEKNRALRVGDWKIVAAGISSPWELYDLSTDRAESHNLADKFPERLQSMSQLWEKQAADYRDQAIKDVPPEAFKKKVKATHD